MSPLENTARAIAADVQQGLEEGTKLSDYFQRQWDLVARRIKNGSVTTLKIEFVHLALAFRNELEAFDHVEKYLEDCPGRSAASETTSPWVYPAVQRTAQELDDSDNWKGIRDALLRRCSKMRALSMCLRAGVYFIHAEEDMPDYESFEQCRATVRRIEKKVDGQQLLASPITINAEDLREIGAIVPDEDVVIAEEVAAQFDLLKRQITSSPWHFNQRLKAAHAAAVTNAEWYRRLSSLVELQEARPPQRIVDASWRLVAIEAVTYCLQLGDDPNRSSILSTLYDNPQVQGHLLGLGTDTNALTQVLDAVTRAQENYVFDEFAVAVVWASVQEYGELPDLQRLMEDIETRFDIDLGCGPSEEICEIATDKQKRSLKTMYQAISRNTITSFNEFVGVVGSEAEAKKHLVAVNRLLIRTLQRDFDTLDSSRPRHYCRWDGGNQRMVRDLWEGDVSLDP